MVTAMTGSGEKLHADRRRRFWLTLGGLAAVGFVVGAVGQGATEISTRGGELPGWAPLAGGIGVVVAVLLVVYGSWRFFVSVDELELADNLWGTLYGYYWYAILFPTWWALNKLGWVPMPDHWAIFISSMIVAGAVYLYRKWRLR